MNRKYIVFYFTFFLSLLLIGCAKDLPPGTYDSSEVGKVKKVVPGVVISKRPIHIYSKSPEVAEGSSSTETHTLDSTGKRKRGYEYVIKLNSGDIVSIAQDEDLKLK